MVPQSLKPPTSEFNYPIYVVSFETLDPRNIRNISIINRQTLRLAGVTLSTKGTRTPVVLSTIMLHTRTEVAKPRLAHYTSAHR